MTTAIAYLFAATALCWVQLLTASLLHAKGWTPPGMQLAFGNRDNMPEASVFAARAGRAASNMLENLALFVAAFIGAQAAEGDAARMALGAAIFFWARVAHVGLYLGGIPYLRTLAWAVGVGGIAVLASAAFA